MTKKLKSVNDLTSLRETIRAKRDPDNLCISVCSGTGCHASGCVAVTEKLRETLKEKNLEDTVDVRTTGCHGFCEKGPIMVIFPSDIFYQMVTPDDVEEIITETIVNNRIVNRLLYTDPVGGKTITYERDVPFYSRQKRVLFGNNGLIDPENIEEYIAVDGYCALEKVLQSMTPEEVISEVKQSGLRGRGGAGFPTWRKWDIARNAKGDTKYIVCNADEGDPGAYMDRSLLEGNPHAVLEGMLIGAYTVGAKQGYIYVRHEYPLAVENVTKAIAQMREYGLLGKTILGTDFTFDIRVVIGAGAFVCGEESALIASIEGKKGEPRQRPPFPAEKGIWGKPTNINNVETWANVPIIISKGADWFATIGTEGSKGTKIFSLVGQINNTGLVEVPMGISLREMVYDIGGGIPGGKKFKAIQTGGPSGGCIPEQMLDLHVDFEELKQAGSMMGSGGMVVMNEDTCMVDTARYFLEFLRDESCGKCLTCREGIDRMLEIVTEITRGKGTMKDLETLQELGELVKDASMCGLGQTAPNPLLSTLKYFKDEYIAHIKDKKCPAGVCRALITYTILEDLCTGCGACLRACPEEAISGEKKEVHAIDQEKCIKCGICFQTCKFDAIKKR